MRGWGDGGAWPPHLEKEGPHPSIQDQGQCHHRPKLWEVLLQGLHDQHRRR